MNSFYKAYMIHFLTGYKIELFFISYRIKQHILYIAYILYIFTAYILYIY